ncbi:MAG: hypothetical protein M3T49_06880 [Candidatus Eremiobacteraeota bacterium]|nr:hypothetical protein [Candidatus Eremiobacteraeota bacterium]
MSVPPTSSLIIPTVKAIAGNPGTTLGDLKGFIPSHLGFDATLSADDLPKLHRRIAHVVEQLVRDGYVKRGEAGALSVTDKASMATTDGSTFAIPEGQDATGEIDGEQGQLVSLLSDAGFVFHSINPHLAVIEFYFKLRQWIVQVWSSDGWLCLRSYIMRLPETPLLRARLEEKLLEANRELYMAKYSVAEKAIVFAELEYRLEHLNGESAKNIVYSFVHGMDKQYAELFRIASGDESLLELEQAFKRDQAG